MVEEEENKGEEEDLKKPIESDIGKEPISKPPKEKSIIEQAREERKLNEELFEKMKKERVELERVNSELALAGKSTIDTTPEPTEHEKYVERAKERYKGTGRDPTLGFKRQF